VDFSISGADLMQAKISLWLLYNAKQVYLVEKSVFLSEPAWYSSDLLEKTAESGWLHRCA